MSIPGEDDAAKIRRLGKALTAVGEAYFFFAEQKREGGREDQVPRVQGPGQRRKPSSSTSRPRSWTG